MVRYMFWMSYLGSRFAGSQYQRTIVTPQHVFQNALALALQVPSQTISSRMASRTDAGVHALRNTVTVNLASRMYRYNLTFDLKLSPTNQQQEGGATGDDHVTTNFPFEPDHLASAVNHVLKEMNFDIRILGCRRVSSGFCPRHHALSRTYLYRLLVLKPEFDNDPQRHRLMRDPMAVAPLVEKDRSWAVGSNFNYESFEKAGHVFEGLHEFRSFSKPQISRNESDEPATTVRSVKLVETLKGQPLIDPRYDPLAGCFDYVDVLVHSKSFVYRQIRKMVGAMVSVAQGRATCDDIRWLLDNPDVENYSKYDLDVAPAGGLYLMNIAYDEKDFDTPAVTYEPEDFETRRKDSIDDKDNDDDDDDDAECVEKFEEKSSK